MDLSTPKLSCNKREYRKKVIKGLRSGKSFYSANIAAAAWWHDVRFDKSTTTEYIRLYDADGKLVSEVKK